MMQLYKLTNTDVTDLRNEYDELMKSIEYLNSILNDENILKNVIYMTLIKKNVLLLQKKSVINCLNKKINREIYLFFLYILI